MSGILIYRSTVGRIISKDVADASLCVSFQEKDYSFTRNEILSEEMYADDRSMLIRSSSEATSSRKSNMKEATNAYVRSNVNDVKKKTYTCKLCSKTFSKKYNLNVHIRIHTGEKPFVCNFCKKTFSHVSNLRMHMKRHHS